MTNVPILEDFKRLELLYAEGFHDTFLDNETTIIPGQPLSLIELLNILESEL